MEPGTIVSFKEEEPVLCEDGSVHKWRDFTVQGVVKETLPSGKVVINYTHPSFDMDATTTRDPKYLTVVQRALLPEHTYLWTCLGGDPQCLKDFIDCELENDRRIAAVKLKDKEQPGEMRILFLSYRDYMGTLEACEKLSRLRVSSAGDWPRDFIYREEEGALLDKAYEVGGDYGKGVIDGLLETFRHDIASYDYCLGFADTLRQRGDQNELICRLLQGIQPHINQGRGSKTIERIVKHLDGTYKGSEAGYDGAKEHWGFDGDKLYQYPLAFKVCHALFGCRLHYDPHCQKCGIETLMRDHLTMKPEYESWIASFLATVGDPLQQCADATLEMQLDFPELERVRGTVKMLAAPDGNTRPWPHWWLVDPKGGIVDPTASQFPSPIVYNEADEDDPIEGRCRECGEYFTRSQATMGICCSQECATAYGDYLNSFNRPH